MTIPVIVISGVYSTFMHRKRRKQLTVRILFRTVLFFTSLTTGLALFFVFGNSQEFMDTTQIIVLSILSGTSLISVLITFTLLLIFIFLLFLNKTKIPMPMLVFFCLIINIFVSIIAHSIILISHG